MKKICVLSALLLTFVSAKSFSLGLGLGFDGGYGSLWGGSLLVSPSKVDHIGVRLNVDGSYFGISASYDHWLLNPTIKAWDTVSLNWFLGLGGNVWTGISSDNFDLGVQARLPVGLDFVFPKSRKWDAYIAVVPQLGVQILDTFKFPSFWIGGALGIRYWF